MGCLIMCCRRPRCMHNSSWTLEPTSRMAAEQLVVLVLIDILRVARRFFWHIFLAWRTDIAHMHGSRCLQCACHNSPSHHLPSHVSFTVFAVTARSPCRTVPDPKALVQRTSAWAPRSLATWPIRRTPHVVSPKRVRQNYFCRWRHDAYQRSELR